MSIGFSDEELTAFLDGASEQGVADAIEAAVHGNADLQQRIKDLSLNTNELRAAFDPLLSVAQARGLPTIPKSAQTLASKDQQSVGIWLRFASYAAAVFAGAVFSWGYFATETDWRVEVAHYQALYVRETLLPITPDPVRLQAEFERAGKALGMSLDPADFANVDGLELRRAQILGFNGATLVQIAFSRADGTPFAFCILRQSGDPSGTETDILVGLAAASWANETHKFLAIGGTDTKAILSVAKVFQQRL